MKKLYGKIEMYNVIEKSKIVHFVKDKDKQQWPKPFFGCNNE